MANTQAVNRVAVLLNLLGTDVAEGVLGEIGPEKQQRLRQRINDLETTPPSAAAIDDIIGEFEKLLQDTQRVIHDTPDLRIANPDNTTKDDGSKSKGDASESTEPFEFTDDPLDDLTRLEPYQIAGALRNESPLTIAMVVDCLDSDHTAAVLSSLPDDTRKEVFLKLNADHQPPAELLQRIVATTVQKACVLDQDSLKEDESDNAQRIADVLRSMERDQRGEMLDALEQSDAEAAAKVKSLLYVFEDLMVIEDRSLQKLLTEVDSRTLATSLKDAEPDLVDKVMRNFSKRARAALTEEMDYMGAINEDEQAAAQNEIVEVIARLDQTGELVMES